MTLDISVIIPVGPDMDVDFVWELLDSLWEQTLKPAEIVLVDDAAHISKNHNWAVGMIPIQIITNPWNLGEAASRNIGTALAKNDWVFQASHDDTLHPYCLEACAEKATNEMGYYYVTLQNGNILQTELGAHGLFHRHLWSYLGGYPKLGGMGLADIAFLDLVMTKGTVVPVRKGTPLYNHRDHEKNQVKQVSGTMRRLNRLAATDNTLHWKQPEWVWGFGYA